MMPSIKSVASQDNWERASSVLDRNRLSIIERPSSRCFWRVFNWPRVTSSLANWASTSALSCLVRVGSAAFFCANDLRSSCSHFLISASFPFSGAAGPFLERTVPRLVRRHNTYEHSYRLQKRLLVAWSIHRTRKFPMNSTDVDPTKYWSSG